MRLPGYDYSQPGWYFVTICTKNRQEVFGVVVDGQTQLNLFGVAVWKCWLDLPNHYSCILDAFVVMPNHVHGIIVIPDLATNLDPNNAPGGLNSRVREEEIRMVDYEQCLYPPTSPPPNVVGGLNPQLRGRENSTQVHPLTEIVRGFKTFSAAAVNRINSTPGA